MKFSLIVPAYNVAEYLPLCLQSLQQQSFSDFEVLVIDDGSSDATGKIAHSFSASDLRFKVFIQKNAGVSAARNFGLRQASGLYVWFIDGDDYIHPRSLEYLDNVFQQYPEADYTTFHCQKVLESQEKKVDNANNLESLPLARFVLSKRDDFIAAFRASPREACLICYKREILANMAFGKFKLGEDTLFNKKVLFSANEVIESQAVLYYYVTRSSSASHSPSFSHVMDYFTVVRELSTLKREKEGAADSELSVFLWQIGLVEGMTRLHLLTDKQQRQKAKESWVALAEHYLAIFQQLALNQKRLKLICWSRSFLLADLFFYIRYIPRHYIGMHPGLAHRLNNLRQCLLATKKT